jgi:secreted PhoX family phosphatase
VKEKKLIVPLLSLSVLLPTAVNVLAAPKVPVSIEKVEFIGMEAPQTSAQQNDMYSSASAKVAYSDGSVKTFPISYELLFKPGDVINGKTAGATYDANGNVIMDMKTDPNNPTPYVSDAPDSNSLMNVKGRSGNLYLVNHYEGIGSNIGELPKSMALNTVKQDKKTGKLTVTDMNPIDFSAYGGIWTPCAGSLSPWNTHLGSEEYEPDAKAHEVNPEKSSVTQFARNFSQDPAKMGNPYSFGYVPEVTVHPNGKTTAVKHYSMGRLSFERVVTMPDNRTLYYGDDGAYTMLFMYVADREGDLSAGSLYAAKWKQTSEQNGGSAHLEWIQLGHATDAEIKELANTLKFSDIFETTTDDAYAQSHGFKKVITQSSGGKAEWLKLKPGMEKAAAFLESRRYGALLGATSEFNKMEAVELNKKDNKVYVAMSGVKGGMEANSQDPVDDIHLPKVSAGGIYELNMANQQKDKNGQAINSEYVASTMAGVVFGEDLAAKDGRGNTANENKIANPDNIVFSEDMRTLFIAEDSGMHTNNFLWAYNIDTKKLSRIASVPEGGEATGLQHINNLNGHSYLMLSAQHPGYVGYLKGLPAFQEKKGK